MIFFKNRYNVNKNLKMIIFYIFFLMKYFVIIIKFDSIDMYIFVDLFFILEFCDE